MCLKKRPKIRSSIENLTLQVYIESSGLNDYLKGLNFDENNIKNFLPNILQSCSFFEVSENKLLIQYNEKIERYYILISGRCKFYKQTKTTMQITMKEYYQLLIQLQRRGDIEKIKKNMEENKDKITIQYPDLDRLNHLLFLQEFKYNLYKCRTKYNDVIKIFNEFFVNLKQYDIDQEELLRFNNSKNFEGLSKYCKMKLKEEFEAEEFKDDLIKYKLNDNANEKLFFRICDTVDLGEIPINSFISEEFLCQHKEYREEIDSSHMLYENNLLTEEKISQERKTNKKYTISKDLASKSNIGSDLKGYTRNSTLNILSDDDNINKLDDIKNLSRNDKVIQTSLNLNKINKFNVKKKPSINSQNHNNEEDAVFCSISIICESDCSFLVINKEDFVEYTNQEKQKIKTRDIVYLTDNFFFGSINKKIFEKKYYEKFELKTYSFESILFREKENPEKLFIVKEGIIEISLNKNLLELTALIKDLIKLEPSLKNSIDNNSDYKANNQLKNIVNEISKKRKITIFKYDSNDIIGMESIFLNHSYFYKATVISKKALIYEIDVNYVKNLNRESNEIRENFYNISLDKLNSFLQRIIYLKNVYLRTFDNKITEEQMKIKMNMNLKKNLEKMEERNINNGVNVLSKEVISLDKYNIIKDMLLNKGNYKRGGEQDKNINNQYEIHNHKKFINYPILVTNISDEENDINTFSKKIVVVNNNLRSKKNETKLNPICKNDNSLRNTRNISNDNNPYSKIRQEPLIENEDEKIPSRKKKILSIDSKTSNIKREIDKSPISNNMKKTKDTNDSSIEIDNRKKKLDLINSLGNSRKNNDSQVESQNVSDVNIEAKKKDFDLLILGEKESKDKDNLKFFKRQNSDNNIDLIKYYNNYKSLRKASINFKIGEFFKEGVPLSTKAFENGSFFVTSNNSEEKIKWRRVDKKSKQNKSKKLFLEEIDPYIDIDVPLNNIVLTSPLKTNESINFVHPRSPFKLKRIDLPIIKKYKYEAEHKKNLENYILKKNKKIKIIDDKIFPIFKSVDDKRIGVSNFGNPNFLGENNDYLRPRNSLKSEHIKDFYKMLQNKKIKGNKLKHQLLSNEN